MGDTVTVTPVCDHCLTTNTNPPQQRHGRSRLCSGHQDAARRYRDAVRQARHRALKAGVNPPEPQAYTPKPLVVDVQITGALLKSEDLAKLAGVSYRLLDANAGLAKALRGGHQEEVDAAIQKALDTSYGAVKVLEHVPGVLALQAIAAAQARATP